MRTIIIRIISSASGATDDVSLLSLVFHLRRNIDNGSSLASWDHLAGNNLTHIYHLLHISIEQAETENKQKYFFSFASLELNCFSFQASASHLKIINSCLQSNTNTHMSKSSGWTSRKGLQMATAALLTRPSITGRDSSLVLVASQSVRSRWTPSILEHSSYNHHSSINKSINQSIILPTDAYIYKINL